MFWKLRKRKNLQNCQSRDQKKRLSKYKNCTWLNLNPGPLILEVTALPTKQQTLYLKQVYCFAIFDCFSLWKNLVAICILALKTNNFDSWNDPRKDKWMLSQRVVNVCPVWAVVVAQLVVVASNTRGPRFKSSHRRKLYWTLFTINSLEKTKIKKKRPWIAHFLKVSVRAPSGPWLIGLWLS